MAQTQKVSRRKFLSIGAGVAIAAAAVGAGYYYYSSGEKTEILIGAAVSQTGSFGPAGRLVVEGYQLWEKEVNAKGGILGRPVRLVLYDDKSEPSTTNSLYKKLITVDEVDLLLGPYTSACALTAAPVAEEYKKVIFQAINNAGGVYDKGWDYNFMVLNIGVAETSMRQFFDWAKTLDPPIEKFAYITTADFFPRAITSKLGEFCDETGIELVYSEEVPKGITDVSVQITKLKEANPDAFHVAGAFGEETLFTRSASSLGFHPKTFTGSLAIHMTDFWNTLKEDAIGVIDPIWYGTRPSMAKVYPVIGAFHESFKNEFGKDPDSKAAGGYAACQVLQAGIEGTNSIDNDEIKNWLLKNKVITVLGPWEVDYEAEQKYGYKWIPKAKNRMTQWHPDGTMPIIYPPEEAEAEPIYPRP